MYRETFPLDSINHRDIEISEEDNIIYLKQKRGGYISNMSVHQIAIPESQFDNFVRWLQAKLAEG